MAAQAVEYFVLLTVAGTQPEQDREDHIVLFSWAVISKSRNQVLTKEQLYVQPKAHVSSSSLPGGIKPESVSSAAPLPVIIEQFQAAVAKLGHSFMLLCPSALPLRHFILREAENQGVQLNDFFYQYVDINTEFSRGFPDNKRPDTLEETCTFLGIEVAPSSPKLGLAELKMVADITQKLIMQGHTFGNPEIIARDTDFNAPADTAMVEEGNVVRLRGLPFQAALEDVTKFLSGLNIITGGIVFGISSVGRRTGEAIVVLETPEMAELAVKRHKFFMDSRYIEVYDTNPDDFLKLVGNQDSGRDIAVVRMQGLPYRAIEDDIVDFFAPETTVKYGSKGVMIVRLSDGRASGDALALFDDEHEADKAMDKNRHLMGSRYVELYRSSLKEFKTVLSRSGSIDQQHHFIDLLDLNVGSSDTYSREGVIGGREKNCVKLRGLPYSAKPEDVINFFGDLGSDIAPQGVHMVLDPMNRPTGDCYVQMLSEGAAGKVARYLHKKNMGRRYIEIFECTGDDVSHALAEGSSGNYRGGGGGGGYHSRGEPRGGRQRHYSGEGAIVKVRGLPYSATESQLANFFDDYNIRDRDCEIVYDSSGRRTGIAYVTFSSRDTAVQAVREKHHKHIGNRYLELYLN